jgi:hypothetical protein
MRSTLLLPFVGVLVSAAPAPQDIKFDVVDALLTEVASSTIDFYAAAPTIIEYDPTDAAQNIKDSLQSDIEDPTPLGNDDELTRRGLDRRGGDCSVQPAGSGPDPQDPSIQGFLNDPNYAAASLGATTPSGYNLAFQNLNASNNAYGYMGYTRLTSYDVKKCTDQCSSIVGCAAVNIYFERDPKLNPGPGCPNPDAVTNIKCAFWGGPVSAQNAVNYGQWREQFQVVITGSNGYVSKGINTPPGYSPGVYLGDAAINAPLDCNGDDTFMGSKIFTGVPFDANLCATACSETSGKLND